MAAENLANNYQTTLAAPATSGATTLTVAAATGIPVAPFRLIVGSELMLCTAISGTTLTVTRGVEGTTAASHASGDALAAVVTAAGLGNAVPTAVQVQMGGGTVTYTPTNAYVATGATLAIPAAGTWLVTYDCFVIVAGDGTNGRDVLLQAHDGTAVVGQADWDAGSSVASTNSGRRVALAQPIAFAGPKTVSLQAKYLQSAGSGSSTVFVNAAYAIKLSN